MNTCSGYHLNNYALGVLDVGLCLITGFTCIPYAKRHWEMSNSHSTHSLGHKVIAIFECIPIVGGIVGLVERIIACVRAFFKNKAKPAEQRKQSVSPKMEALVNTITSEFTALMNANNKGTIELTEKETKEFLIRGGTLNIFTGDQLTEKPILLRREQQVITGCTSGVNRSQVAAAVIKKMGIQVFGILAGGDSGMNPELEYSIVSKPSDSSAGAKNFESVFGYPKPDQIGFKESEDEEDADALKEFYQNYINRLSSTHFITFGRAGLSVVRRLLKREGSLEGFAVSYSPLGDEIVHPPQGVNSHSKEAYLLFAKKIRNCFALAVS